MSDHARCDRIRMCLAEGGLDPARMFCNDDGYCSVQSGIGDEGMTYEQVDAITDKAIALAAVPSTDQQPCPRCGKTWLNGTCDDTVSRRARCLGAASPSDSKETP